MSVLVPDLEVYKAVYRKIMSYSYNKQCDINFCGVFLSFSEKDAETFIKDLLYLNEWSYIEAYGEDKSVKPQLHNDLVLERSGDTISSIQMLKFLHCISYNIELKELTNKYVVDPFMIDKTKMLDHAIREIQMRIITELTDYNELDYASVSVEEEIEEELYLVFKVFKDDDVDNVVLERDLSREEAKEMVNDYDDHDDYMVCFNKQD